MQFLFVLFFSFFFKFYKASKMVNKRLQPENLNFVVTVGSNNGQLVKSVTATFSGTEDIDSNREMTELDTI